MQLFITISAFFVLVQSTELGRLREIYFKASEDKSHIEKMKITVEKSELKNNLYYCYKAAVYALEARHAKDLAKKISNFNQFKNAISKSIALGDSYDARLVRFCVQLYSPKILNYRSELEKDKNFLLSNYSSQKDEKFKRNIRGLLLSSGLLTPEEKNRLN